MGIFKSIFSSNKPEHYKKSEKELRAEHKNHKYYEKELVRVNKLIAGDKVNDEIYLRTHDTLLPSHYSGTYSTQKQKVELMYSYGCTVKEIRAEFIKALPNFIQGWDEIGSSYSNFFNIITLSVLLNIDKEYMKTISEQLLISDKNKKNESIKPDKLLWFLLNAMLEEKKEVPDTLVYKKYKIIARATTENKEKAEVTIKEYLSKWYELNKGAPWYENHKRPWGYSGYWCWEAGAVVKIMGLDDSSFKNHPHYPYDMVHWQDSESV